MENAPLPEPLPRRHAYYFALAAALGLALAWVFLLHYGDGRVALPLDDSYIHLQFARQLAAGHFFQYIDGEGYCKGETSVLWPILLAPLHWLPLGHDARVALVMLFGTVLLALSAWLFADLVYRATGDRTTGLLGGLLYVLTGHLLYGYLSGMEVGLVCTALLWMLWGMARDRLPHVVAAGVALALSRPEGALLAAVACAVPWVRSLWLRARLHRPIPWASPWLLLPVLAGAVQPLLHLFFTGSPSSNTLYSLGALSPDPALRPDWSVWLERGAGGLRTMMLDTFAQQFLGYLPVVGLVLAVFGLWAFAARTRNVTGWPLGPIVLLWAFGVPAVQQLLVAHNYHQGRYQMPFLPLLLLGVVYGVWAPASGSNGRLRPAPILCVFLGLSTFWWVNMALVFGLNGSDIARQHAAATDLFLERHPAYAGSVAINDAGYIPYVSGLRTFDFYGLTTNKVARHTLPEARCTHLFEHLERRQAHGDTLPADFIGYLDWFEPFRRLGVFQPQAAIRLDRPSVAGAPEMALAQLDWSLLGSGERCPLARDGWTVVDRLDIADFDDERAHNYRIRPVPPHRVDARPLSALREPDDARAADGGRIICGIETLTLEAHAAAPARLVLRTLSAPGCVQEIRVDGGPPDLWRLRGAEGTDEGAWVYETYDFPAAAVRDGALRLRLDSSAWRRGRAVFHYWLLQREAPQP